MTDLIYWMILKKPPKEYFDLHHFSSSFAIGGYLSAAFKGCGRVGLFAFFTFSQMWIRKLIKMVDKVCCIKRPDKYVTLGNQQGFSYVICSKCIFVQQQLNSKWGSIYYYDNYTKTQRYSNKSRYYLSIV